MLLHNVKSQTKIDFLQASPFFSGFSQDILIELERGAYVAKYAPGEIILVEGDCCGDLYHLISGSIKLYKLSPGGRELIVTVFESGTTFNEVPVIDGGRNPINVAALVESTVLIIPRSVFLQAIQKHPEQYHILIERLAANLRNLIGLIEELAFYQIPNRLARLLLRLPEDHGYTQDQLAAHLGTVREVISRALHDLEKAGAIRCQRRRVNVVDRALLEIWANRPDPVQGQRPMALEVNAEGAISEALISAPAQPQKL